MIGKPAIDAGVRGFSRCERMLAFRTSLRYSQLRGRQASIK